MFKSAPPGEFNEILIVDDDLDTREILADLLQHRGYSTASVADGREALDFLRTYHPPRVILLEHEDADDGRLGVHGASNA